MSIDIISKSIDFGHIDFKKFKNNLTALYRKKFTKFFIIIFYYKFY